MSSASSRLFVGSVSGAAWATIESSAENRKNMVSGIESRGCCKNYLSLPIQSQVQGKMRLWKRSRLVRLWLCVYFDLDCVSMPECVVLSVWKSYRRICALLIALLSPLWYTNFPRPHSRTGRGNNCSSQEKQLEQRTELQARGEIIDLIREVDRLHVVRLPAVARQKQGEKTATSESRRC